MMLRSLLFAGATRPELVAKLPRSRPDGCVIDLEDAVPAAHKQGARASARRLADELAAGAPWAQVYVRVNAVSSSWFAGDIEDALTPALAGVVVPKLERRDELEAVRQALAGAGLTGLQAIAGIESAVGVMNVVELLEPPVVAAYFGAEDYIADLGGRRTAEGLEVLYARSRVVLGARVAGVHALDQVVVDFRDDEAFTVDAARGRDLGYAGKLCIHPRQVALAHAAFTPEAEELERSRRMLESFERCAGRGTGAFEFEGQMVDEPALRSARALLARSGAAAQRAEPGDLGPDDRKGEDRWA
jgi:citrate lyase subunit beta/citryl-CoA lyase